MIEIKIIAALLHDVHSSRGIEFNSKALRLTLRRVEARCLMEGMGFLTKTLPRLGKALDRALAGEDPLNAVGLGFKPLPNSKLPRFLGELFSKVLNNDGELLPNPCATSVGILRNVLFLFYKYELPYSDEQEQQVIAKFTETERQLSSVTKADLWDRSRGSASDLYPHSCKRRSKVATTQEEVIRRAQNLLERLFARFDPTDINPRHGPGAVATKQQLAGKYRWTNVSRRITELYPFDAYFCASPGHVCDSYDTFKCISEEDLPARVILVPKDSRGPRLISCEPVDKQWVQQGLGRAIVELVEHTELTKYNVFFTDQQPNQIGALYGSRNGRYATLDLNEASDRVSLDLVRLLFPVRLTAYLEACRSPSTELPNGEIIQLQKFAPMGSALCFPILALTVWAILTAAAPDTDTRECIHVYGDDVIVPTAFALNAIEQLEFFGLKVNRDKSCIKGLFRESCGMDAFNGICVTPVRIRTVWSSSRSPDVYSSWIAYANSFWDKQYYAVYDLIVDELHRVYGGIPAKDMHLACPSLASVPDQQRPKVRRTHYGLQKLQWKVWDIKSPAEVITVDGWSMLLRYFAEVANDRNRLCCKTEPKCPIQDIEAFSVSTYTRRKTSILVKRWR